MTTPPFNKLTDVRILTLPRMTVASAQYTGRLPENCAHKMIDDFIEQSGLATVKPDARLFGFNSPDPEPNQDVYGYEFWITIPDDFEVPASLKKKVMPGGLYAVHTITVGNFDEWHDLIRWIHANEEYDVAYRDAGMGGLLEEHLNCFDWPEDEAHQQIDLYLPIKRR